MVGASTRICFSCKCGASASLPSNHRRATLAQGFAEASPIRESFLALYARLWATGRPSSSAVQEEEKDPFAALIVMINVAENVKKGSEKSSMFS